MNMVVTYFGISLCLTGAITPATVFTFNIYNREIASEIRWLSGDMIPSMIGMTLPLGLLCAVLGSGALRRANLPGGTRTTNPLQGIILRSSQRGVHSHLGASPQK